ncbi:MAG: hypothetical protein QOE24_1770 [Frankiales bacterium]|jgi:hypothetical protein|nr:hypothetical protein [Frankiales bacterium]MDX6209379.1 hypothetical protein [Frankiales bacterium]
MGRGRAKAKQTKVARELKYSSGGTDLDRLRAELAGEPVVRPVPSETDQDDEYTDPYAGDLDDDPDDTGQDHRTA